MRKDLPWLLRFNTAQSQTIVNAEDDNVLNGELCKDGMILVRVCTSETKLLDMSLHVILKAQRRPKGTPSRTLAMTYCKSLS